MIKLLQSSLQPSLYLTMTKNLLLFFNTTALLLYILIRSLFSDFPLVWEDELKIGGYLVLGVSSLVIASTFITAVLDCTETLITKRSKLFISSEAKLVVTVIAIVMLYAFYNS